IECRSIAHGPARHDKPITFRVEVVDPALPPTSFGPQRALLLHLEGSFRWIPCRTLISVGLTCDDRFAYPRVYAHIWVSGTRMIQTIYDEIIVEGRPKLKERGYVSSSSPSYPSRQHRLVRPHRHGSAHTHSRAIRFG